MPPNANISDEEMDLLPSELQLLGNEHSREKDVSILMELLEVLYLVIVKGGDEGKKEVKDAGGYLIVRELHLAEGDEGVRAGCERVVDVLLVGELEKMHEGGEGGEDTKKEDRIKEVQQQQQEEEKEEEEEEKIVEVF